MNPSHVSASIPIFGTFSSNFLRSVREFCLYRPHVRALRGSESLQRKKLAGERRLCYDEVVTFLSAARRDGARRGQGPEAVAVLVNELIRDTLAEGEPLDVIARPVDGDLAALNSRRDEELNFAVGAAELITVAETVSADGRVDYHEARLLEGAASKTTRCARRVVASAIGARS